MYDEINCFQSAPQVEQPLANFESTPTPTTTQSASTPSAMSDFYI